MMQVASAVQEDGLQTLMLQLDRGLEDSARRRGAADVITHFCVDTDLDFQEHTSDLLAVRGCALTRHLFPFSC